MAQILCATLVLVALAGCGQSGDRAAVRATTERFLSAYEAKDAPAACAELSLETRAELESSEQRSCPQVVTGLELGGGGVTGVEVAVVNAKVDLSSGESVFLGKVAAGWKISALGCRPGGGGPTSRPLDCELEA